MNKDLEAEQLIKRFDRDASLFTAIYKDDRNVFLHWLNKHFRKPIYERFDIAFKSMGNIQDKNIIDVGCGTGIYCTNLALKGAHRVLGVDFSMKMFEIAMQKIKELHLERICELKHADFLKIDLNEKFDFALAMGVFDYLSDPVTFLRKLKSITTDKVIASFPGHSAIREPLRKFRYWLTSRGKVYFYDKADIEAILAIVKFKNVELVPIKTGQGHILIATP